MSELKVLAELDEGSVVRLQAGNHSWFADEPVEADGTDKGPNPYELLLSSLGACMALTLRMYTKHKGWPLESVRVECSFAREYARDCAECSEDGDARLDVVRAKVEIRGSFDARQQVRLTQIVARCPVHRTLDGGPEMFETVEFVG